MNRVIISKPIRQLYASIITVITATLHIVVLMSHLHYKYPASQRVLCTLNIYTNIIHCIYLYTCCINRHKVRAARVKLHGQRAMATTKCVWTGLKSKHATRPKHMPIRRSWKAVRGKVKHKLQSRKRGKRGGWGEHERMGAMGIGISDSSTRKWE